MSLLAFTATVVVTLVPAPAPKPATPAEHWCRHHVRECRAHRPKLAAHALLYPVHPPHTIRARSVS